MFPGTVSTVHSTFAFRRMQFRLLHSPWYSWNRGVSVEEGVFFRLCWSLHWIRRICGRRCHNKHVFELGFPFLSPWSLRWLLTWLNTNVGFRSPLRLGFYFFAPSGYVPSFELHFNMFKFFRFYILPVIEINASRCLSMATTFPFSTRSAVLSFVNFNSFIFPANSFSRLSIFRPRRRCHFVANARFNAPFITTITGFSFRLLYFLSICFAYIIS